jgi:cytochrome c553
LKSLIAAIVVATGAAARAEPVTNPRLVLVCAPCHGFDGIGHDNTIPNLAGQSREYLRRQLFQFRSGERKHPAMNFFSGQINQEELEQLVDYYASKTRQ